MSDLPEPVVTHPVAPRLAGGKESEKTPHDGWTGRITVSIFTHPDRVAIIYEADEGCSITYAELLREVCSLANVLTSSRCQESRHRQHLPPHEWHAAAAFLACAHIGAIHSVIFANFSAESLRDRVNDCGRLRGRRGGIGGVEGPELPAADHGRRGPTFILYTSGSTGKPKGVVHTTGGYLLCASLSIKYVFDVHPGDRFACIADVGWIARHTYITYGPLLNGVSTLMFENSPVYPSPARYWETVVKHKVTQFYSAPTAVRLLSFSFGGRDDEPREEGFYTRHCPCVCSGAFDESSSPLLVWERTGCLFWRRRAGFWISVLGEGDILLVLSWCWRTGGRGLSLVDLWCALAVAIGALVVDTRSANSFLVPAYLGLGVPPLLVSGCYGFVASTFPHVAAPPPRLWYEGMKEGTGILFFLFRTQEREFTLNGSRADIDSDLNIMFFCMRLDSVLVKHMFGSLPRRLFVNRLGSNSYSAYSNRSSARNCPPPLLSLHLAWGWSLVLSLRRNAGAEVENHLGL
ncbi:hypothetical protein B0H13DRAFT_2402200 [Mycena leptocephala]|nr:hypothetical protein B0H13DRAFT_2402200 [Mycena leptocephala]